MVRFFTQIIIVFFVSLNFIYTQVVYPTLDDSLIAGRKVDFHFKTKTLSIQYFEYSLDNRNWVELGRFFNRTTFSWFPPLADIDSIFFNYESLNFTYPILVWKTPNVHTTEITSIDYFDDEGVVLSSSSDGRICIWSTEKQELIDSYSSGKPVLFAKFLFSSRKVIFSADSSIYLYDFEKPNSFRRVSGSSALIRAIDVCPKNKLTAFGSFSGDVVLLDSNLNEIKKFSLERKIYSIKFSKSGYLLAVGDYDGIVTIFDINLDEKVAEFVTNRDNSYKNVVWSVAFSPEDTLVIAGGIDGKSRIYNLKTKELEYSIPSHSFHIRGVDFCDVVPVVISVSLDSTISQVFYPLNISLHIPLKEESAISFLKVIGGGAYFLVGMRNGKISLYKNFEFEYIKQKFSLPYFIPISVLYPSIQSYAGRVVSFPVILKNIYEVPLNRFFNDTSYAVLQLPAEHFGVYHDENKALKFGWEDTIYSKLRSVVNVDTFAIVYVYTLHPWGDRKATFKINHIDFRGKKNILWIFDTATVEIVEVCKPLTNLMKFELMPKVNFFADYNNNEGKIELRVENDKTIFCKFLLINPISGHVKVLLEKECYPSETLITLDARNIASGLYIIVLETSFTSLAKKLIIYQ